VVFTLLSICLLRALYFCYSVLNHVYFFLLCDFPLYPFTQRLPTLFSLLKCVSTTLTPFFSITLCALKKARLLFFFYSRVKATLFLFFFCYSANKKSTKTHPRETVSIIQISFSKGRNKVCVSSFCCISFLQNLLVFRCFPPSNSFITP